MFAQMTLAHKMPAHTDGSTYNAGTHDTGTPTLAHNLQNFQNSMTVKY